jgi:hypothetical protein
LQGAGVRLLLPASFPGLTLPPGSSPRPWSGGRRTGAAAGRRPLPGRPPALAGRRVGRVGGRVGLSSANGYEAQYPLRSGRVGPGRGRGRGRVGSGRRYSGRAGRPSGRSGPPAGRRPPTTRTIVTFWPSFVTYCFSNFKTRLYQVL